MYLITEEAINNNCDLMETGKGKLTIFKIGLFLNESGTVKRL